MALDEKTVDIRDQEDQTMSPLIAFDQEKLLAMQNQLLEGIAQHGKTVLIARSDQHIKGAREDTSSRSLEEYEIQ
jgi:hypothetical protein